MAALLCIIAGKRLAGQPLRGCDILLSDAEDAQHSASFASGICGSNSVVEFLPSKQAVAGSSPVSRSTATQNQAPGKQWSLVFMLLVPKAPIVKPHAAALQAWALDSAPATWYTLLYRQTIYV